MLLKILALFEEVNGFAFVRETGLFLQGDLGVDGEDLGLVLVDETVDFVSGHFDADFDLVDLLDFAGEFRLGLLERSGLRGRFLS